MEVYNTQTVEVGDQVEVSAWVDSPHLDQPFKLYFRIPAAYQDYISPNGDVYVASLLAVASFFGEDLSVSLPVSKKLLSNTNTFLEILDCWYKPDLRFHPVIVKSTVGVNDDANQVSQPKGVGTFFSLGVDSTFTLMKNISNVDHLVIINGYDAWQWEDRYLQQFLQSTGDVIDAFGKKLTTILVSTNLRDLTDRYLDWSKYISGAGLANIALFLGKGLGKCYIPSTLSYRELIPWGSHPLLDPLWSTHYTEILHDGSGFNRLEKISQISKHPDLLKNLRVCYKFNRSRFNCGACMKCVRTMIALHICGSLETCPTLPHRIPLDVLREFRIESKMDRLMFQEMVMSLGNTPEDEAIKDAIEEALRNGKNATSRNITQDIQTIREQINQGQYELAYPALVDLSGKAPNQPEVQYLTGFCRLVLKKELDQALQNFDRALQLGFDEFWVFYNRGNLFMEIGDISNALFDLKKAARINPQHDGARMALGRIAFSNVNS